MSSNEMLMEACPRCKSTAQVSHKLLLINAADRCSSSSRSAWRHGCACKGFSIDDLKPEFSDRGPVIEGLYCDACSVGYVPDFMAKPAPPTYQISREGFQRVFEDGSIGPLLQRIADDPDSQR